MKTEKQHILMTGGGTLGPVTPLMAIAQEWLRRNPDAAISWIGTPRGPERIIIEAEGYAFYPLFAPKISRHKKWTWPFIPLAMAYSCVRAFLYLRRLRPDMVFTAGGYVSVPVIWMAWLLRIPAWVHQLDVTPGIANRAMAPFAKRISVTWLETLEKFPQKKTRHAGAMVRNEIEAGDKGKVFEKYKLDSAKPTVFVLGGGTGAQSVNDAMEVIAPRLLKRANVIHLTGPGKMTDTLQELGPGYAALEFLGSEIADAYDAADVVVCRAGMGTLLELSATGKAAILVPIANTDQLANAKAVEEKEAARVIWRLNPQILQTEIERMLGDDELRWGYEDRVKELFPQHGEERVVKEAVELLG